MPSLVNLAHVCSHLQNASHARLGLTSIPYTRLHLSLALLLHKQGFLDYVKLGGAQPPASCFPKGTRFAPSSYHDERLGGERALLWAVNKPVKELREEARGERRSEVDEEARMRDLEEREEGKGLEMEDGEGKASQRRDRAERRQRLRQSDTNYGEAELMAQRLEQEGFDQDAIDFALTRRLKSKSQLERNGWHHLAADFLIANESKTADQLAEAGFDEQRIAFMHAHRPLLEESKTEVQKWYGQDPTSTLSLRPALHATILRQGFSAEALRHFAGEDNVLISPRELALDGLDLDVMGQTVSNQPLAPMTSVSSSSTHAFQTGSSRNQNTLQLNGIEESDEGTVTQENRASRRLWLGLKYHQSAPVLSKARMISKPTKRIAMPYSRLGYLVRGKEAGEVKPLAQIGEIMAVSTPLGLLDVRECVERKVGGLLLCRFW